MGCLGVAVIAALSLAVPASIARTSLAGALIVLALLAAASAAAVVVNGRRRGALPDAVAAHPTRALAWVGVLTIAYAAVVIGIHVA